MKDSSTRRFRLVAILAPMIAIALGSFWLLEVTRRNAAESAPGEARAEPDFYVENFNYIKVAKNGKVQYHVSGARLTHNPQDDSYDIQHPVVVNVGNATTPMTMRSERAHVNSDSSEVHLYDNVHMDRPASGDSVHMHMTSEYLLVLPDDDVMRTDKPVQINYDKSVLTGTGMFANNATREFKLASNVHGTYQAPAR
jgi:lipopolysaccharide export system protein LptC